MTHYSMVLLIAYIIIGLQVADTARRKASPKTSLSELVGELFGCLVVTLFWLPLMIFSLEVEFFTLRRNNRQTHHIQGNE